MLELVKIFGKFGSRCAYTHFATSTADYNDPFVLEQFARFKEGVAQIEDAGITLTYKHCCNSAAIAWFREAYGTHVRSCPSILGHMAMEDGREPIGLKSRWKSAPTSPTFTLSALAKP